MAAQAKRRAEATASEDTALVRRALADLNHGGAGLLRIYRPRPTAAFSPRDMAHARYAAVAEAMRARGFEPVERGAGGQLAVYDEGALVVDLVAPHAAPRDSVRERFRLFSAAIASALAGFGIDARVGSVSGEYCPGEFSVNGEGRIKLAGIAQRINRRGYHLGAVISVLTSGAAKAAVAEAYGMMGIAFDPATFGAVADLAPAPSFAALSLRIGKAAAEANVLL